MAPPTSSRPVLAIAALAILSAGALLVFTRLGPPSDALVVYCAHDSLYSQEILRQFERETGIRVSIRFDTEATKSLGLVNLLIAEKDHPRCDVFWNNEVLGTIDLEQQDVLEPYRGPGYERIPLMFKDRSGFWTGFGGRMRVWIVNTDRMPATQSAIAERLAGDDLSRVAIAKPLYGTTLTHYSLLWYHDGPEALQQWHAEAVKRGLQVVEGNAVVKNLVAEGVCDCGWTDTDDYYVGRDDRHPVKMLPVRVDGATILIPNSVAIIRGTKRRKQAEQLVDFLLSEQTELALAQSRSRQVPLGPVDESQLPKDVVRMRRWAEEGSDLRPLAASRDECLRWLKEEYLQ